MALKLFRRKSKAPVVKEPEKEVKKIVEVRFYISFSRSGCGQYFDCGQTAESIKYTIWLFRCI